MQHYIIKMSLIGSGIGFILGIIESIFFKPMPIVGRLVIAVVLIIVFGFLFFIIAWKRVKNQIKKEDKESFEDLMNAMKDKKPDEGNGKTEG